MNDKNDKNDKEIQELVEEHWNWLQDLLKKVYIGAFIHGFKHGMQGKREMK